MNANSYLELGSIKNVINCNVKCSANQLCDIKVPEGK